mgnify:CR=1 FL=1
MSIAEYIALSGVLVNLGLGIFNIIKTVKVKKDAKLIEIAVKDLDIKIKEINSNQISTQDKIDIQKVNNFDNRKSINTK